MHLTAFYKADLYSLRSVSWIDSGSEAPGGVFKFATAGNSGQLRFWDVRRPCGHLAQHSVTYYQHIMSMAPCRDPLGFCVVVSDGSVSFLKMESDGFTVQSKALTKNCLFSSSFSPKSDFCSVSTAGGEVLLMDVKSTFNKKAFFRNKAAMKAISQMSYNGERDSLVIKDHTKDPAAPIPSSSQLLTPSQVHVYQNAWMPGTVEEWNRVEGIAHGTGSGLVRVQFFHWSANV